MEITEWVMLVIIGIWRREECFDSADVAWPVFAVKFGTNMTNKYLISNCFILWNRFLNLYMNKENFFLENQNFDPWTWLKTSISITI